jgi:hypothetical protein
VKTDRLTPPPRQRQEDFACPPWTEAIEAIAEQSSAWPWQQRPAGRHENDRTTPNGGARG